MQTIRDYCEEYLEKVFYFCLRKTGNEQDAEDLAGDIGYEVLASLRRGVQPDNFSAWVWGIARHRYAKWAKQRWYSPEAPSEEAEVMADLLGDPDNTPEEEVLLREELSLMKRELAFIRTDYRRILVAHYIEEKSVSAIAREFALPLGTVKTRLIASRQKLKEGMNMAREFGKRSYNPEEICFTNSCSAFGDRGQPWSILEHILYKNIFLEVYANPESAEELSLEMGIALPYMESELEFLTRETFLVKSGDKYETAFPIISARTQQMIAEYNGRRTGELTGCLQSLVDRFTSACEKAGIAYYGTGMGYADAKWMLLMRAFDWLIHENDQRHEYTVRPYNGRWDIVGYEDAHLPDHPQTGNHGVMSTRKDLPDIHFQHYRFSSYGLENRTPAFLTHEEAYTIQLAAQGRADEGRKGVLDTLVNYGYLRREGENYLPAIPVFNGCSSDQYWAKLADEDRAAISELAGRIREILRDMNRYSSAEVTKELPPRFRNDERMCAFACANCRIARSEVLELALENGWLRYTEQTSPVVGAYLVLNDN